MMIYAGTIREHCQAAHYFRDQPEALPSGARERRSYLYCPAHLPWVQLLRAIKATEADGERISWRVGGISYESERGIVERTPPQQTEAAR